MQRIYEYLVSVSIVLSLPWMGYVPTGVHSPNSPSNVLQNGPLKQTGPTFTLDEANLHRPVTLVVYGDTRFTDPTNETATNPAARRALVARIALEKPDAVFLTGDVPLRGGDRDDYSVYLKETDAWRTEGLHIYPALGNHEFHGCQLQQCLENWWNTFPQLRNRRWYSVAIGQQVYAIVLDSDASLLPGSEQRIWLEAQISSLPASVRFVLVAMHHPPVADIQRILNVDHNPRPNEIALADFLEHAAITSKARFLVIAGHIHNYERFFEDRVTYIVSGGGGAPPYPVERTASDLYKDNSFPNFHYIKLVLEGNALNGTMYRLDLSAATPRWEAKDTFQLRAKN